MPPTDLEDASETPAVEIHAVHPTRQIDAARVEAAIDAVCTGENVQIASLSVVLADRDTVWAVNREWLQHDYPTDVVSFVLDEDAQARGEIDGEIYVDLDMAAERAGEFDATPEQEALRYVIHGLLHLVGYDDATDDQRAAMRQLEDQYLGEMSLPSASSIPEGESRDAILRVVHERGLVGLANNTKWDALLTAMRDREDWTPSYRCKCVDSPHVSGWDTEWFYHLPFPLLSVEWLDIGLEAERYVGRLLPRERIDHSTWVLPLLDEIGFDTHRAGDIVRIFGYAPRDLSGLDIA